MKKIAYIVIIAVLSTVMAPAQNGGNVFDQEYATLTAQWQKQRKILDDAYFARLQALKLRAESSKIGDNSVLVKKLNEQLSQNAATLPADLWYVGRWSLKMGTGELIVVMTADGLNNVNQKTNLPYGEKKPVTVLSDGKVETIVGVAKVVFNKTTPNGDRARLDWWSDSGQAKPTTYTAIKIAAN